MGARGRAWRSVALGAAGAVLVGVASACGSSGSPAAGAGGAPVAAATTSSGPAPLTILVSNDDGVAAPGIDAVVNALRGLHGVTVVVVAPAGNQSGTGGKTSPATPAHTDARTASGVPATAVDGFPADSVNVALDVLGIRPNLVVSGINQGQNLGPVADLSGTVGAARAAAARGIPALASSLGLGATYDYDQAAALVVDWVGDHRAQLTGTGGAALPTVANLNVPNCGTAKIRGEKELDSEPKVADLSTALTNGQRCSSTQTPADEVGAFNVGFATLTTISATPASG